MNKRTLGQIIKQKRLELALTQRELANQLGVKASHVAYIESGRRKPSLTLIRRIADALGLDRQEISCCRIQRRNTWSTNPANRQLPMGRGANSSPATRCSNVIG
jgi:transcriptional regulator with XRE-family HTH domain